MSEFKYVAEEREDTYGIKKLQDKILEIMVYLDGFLRAHNIRYYLMGGSALGAIRHKGFIPWDDDMDIFIPYHDYLKFLDICEKELDTERFYLQREESKELPDYYSKLRMNGTTCIEEVNKNKPNMHQGIFVDIMCLNNAAPTRFGKIKQYYCAGLLKARTLTKMGYKTDSKKKKIELFISRLVVNGPIKKFLLHEVRKYNKKETVEKAHLFGRAKLKNSFYLTDDFGEPRYVDFETVKLAVPQNAEHYLEERYGKDYMEMPSEETKAIYQSHAMIWDTEKDYKEYINGQI